MGPKKGGGGAPKQKNATEEVEETLQAVVCFPLFSTGFLIWRRSKRKYDAGLWIGLIADFLFFPTLYRSWLIRLRRNSSRLHLIDLGCVTRTHSLSLLPMADEEGKACWEWNVNCDAKLLVSTAVGEHALDRIYV